MAKKSERKPSRTAKRQVKALPAPDQKQVAVTSEPDKRISQEVITKEKIKSWLVATGKVRELNQGEVDQFLEICQAYQLNPFKREIHVNLRSKDDPTKRALQITIGYEVYLKRAERINSLDGWKCWTEGAAGTMIAKIEIYRKDRRFPFGWEVRYSEAVQDSPLWKKMPAFMLKKVCIAQGFRLCFPDELGGIPYMDAEMPEQNKEYENIPDQSGSDEIIVKAEMVEPDPDAMTKEEREMIFTVLDSKEKEAFKNDVLNASKLGGDAIRDTRKKYRELYKTRIVNQAKPNNNLNDVSY